MASYLRLFMQSVPENSDVLDDLFMEKEQVNESKHLAEPEFSSSNEANVKSELTSPSHIDHGSSIVVLKPRALEHKRQESQETSPSLRFRFRFESTDEDEDSTASTVILPPKVLKQKRQESGKRSPLMVWLKRDPESTGEDEDSIVSTVRRSPSFIQVKRDPESAGDDVDSIVSTVRSPSSVRMKRDPESAGEDEDSILPPRALKRKRLESGKRSPLMVWLKRDPDYSTDTDEDAVSYDTNELQDCKYEPYSEESFMAPDVHATDEDDVSHDTNEAIQQEVYDKVEMDFEDLIVPDSHASFVSPPAANEVNETTENDREQNAGKRVRITRRRGRGALLHQKRDRKGKKWKVGHPLNEIWATDNDVPVELRTFVEFMKTRVRMVDDERDEKRNGDMQSERENSSESDVEFLEASDEMRRPLKVKNRHFEWSPMESFRGKEEPFRLGRTGSFQLYTLKTAYDAFRSYWDDNILDLIVNETNRYASKCSVQSQSNWFPTNSDEILCLFAFWIMLSIIKMPTIKSCFSVDPLLKTEVFRRIFTFERYLLLVRALQYYIESVPSYVTNTSNAGNMNRLNNLKPIVAYLNSRFKANYIPDKNIYVDESLVNDTELYKAGAWQLGIRIYELCESTTGYMWSIITDTGIATSVRRRTAIVKKLIDPLLNKGYRLFLNECYTSPLLARFLKQNGTDCVGMLSLKPLRVDIPVLVNEAPLKRGDLIARHSGDVVVLSWKDKERITMISTCHGVSSALPQVPFLREVRESREYVVPYKPQVVLDYNKFGGRVNLKDQTLEPYIIERKRSKNWRMKLFKRLVNVSFLNTRILISSSTPNFLELKDVAFRLHLVDTILTRHLHHCPS